MLYTYDSSGSRAAQRDLLERRRVADAVTLAGPDEDLITTYSYDPVFHQLVTTSDPRESSLTFVLELGSTTKTTLTKTWWNDFGQRNERGDVTARVGDLIGFDFDESQGSFSHFGIVVQVRDGRFGVIGKGSSTAAEIAPQLRCALTPEGEAALRAADRLLFPGQELNFVDPR